MAKRQGIEKINRIELSFLDETELECERMAQYTMILYRAYQAFKNSNKKYILDNRAVEYRQMDEWNVCFFHSKEFFDILHRAVFINIELVRQDTELEEVMYSKDGELVNIILQPGSDWNWKWLLLACPDLQYLSIDRVLKIPNDIFELKSLKYLSFDACNLDGLNLERVCELSSLETLDFELSNLRMLPKSVVQLKNLRALSFSGTHVTNLPDDLDSLVNLEYLAMNRIPINRVMEPVMELSGLKELFLGQTKIKELPDDMRRLKKLEHLAIWETGLETIPDWVCTLKELKGLYLGRTKKIEHLPEQIGRLVNLEQLSLDGTGLKELPESFGQLSGLKELRLRNTKIQKIPEFINLDGLRLLDLCNVVIERIPRSVINSGLDIYMDGQLRNRGLLLGGTKILCQPVSLFTHEKEFIYSYYEEEKIHLNESKIVFLGDGEAGKSHIIERIKKDGSELKQFQEQSTPGIAISQKYCRIDRETVCLQIWDFGGQEIMHSMHRFFLTERTLYVIVVNARDNTQDDRAKYWLNNIKSFADGCPVIIVLNKMDQNPTASMNERLLKNDYPQIADVLKMSALKDNSETFGILMNSILEIVKTFDSYAMDFPVSWNRIKMTLTDMEDNYIVDSKYREICANNHVEDEQIQNWLLDWFHDLGISFNYHRKDQLLGGYMVLKPAWITNAIYIILFNGADYAQNGIISIESIIELLKNPPRSVENIRYYIEEVPYILGVMRRFEISYAIDYRNEFIPMMCDKNQHKDVPEFLSGDCLEYFMEYSYLPNNVLHKLMIKIRDDIDTRKIWLTGLMTSARENQISALIRMHDNRIEIFIQSKNNRTYPRKEYLSGIRGYLMQINRELNLKAKDMIIYKENGMSEEIAYDMLLIYLSSGQNEYFSPVFRKLIPIWKILGIVEDKYDTELIVQMCLDNKNISYQHMFDALTRIHAEVNSYEKFEEDLIISCQKIQGNSLQIYEGQENDRNTYLRDLLTINKRYLISDQTLNGQSVNKKGSGELDLLVKNYREQPLAVVEAMNLDSVNKNYIAEHIDKLFLYDTFGLDRNFIVCYVKIKKFASFCKQYQAYLHQHEYTYPLQSVKERSDYSEIRLYDVVLTRNEKNTMITHVLVHLQEKD